MNNDPLPKLGMVFLGRRRPGFDMEWGKRMEERVRGWIKTTGFGTFEPSEKAMDDTSLRKVMAECDAQHYLTWEISNFGTWTRRIFTPR